MKRSSLEERSARGVKRADAPSKFKIDIIENIPPDETISLYRNGDFIDLCAGPHVMRTGTSARSSSRRGQRLLQRRRKNPQLQRVYGTAFKTKKDSTITSHARGSEETRPSQAWQGTANSSFLTTT
jgi:threonyl-tRNA synthetase